MINYCEQFCEPNTTVIVTRFGGRLPTEDTIGECADCVRLVRFLCHEVLPTIRRNGYWVPAGTPMELELAAMVDQDGLADRLGELIGEIFGGGAA